MIGVQAIAEAAKRELGDNVLKNPVRVSCPSCGKFLVAAFVAPNLLRDRCDRCRVDVIALISREREVLAVTEK